MLQMCCFAVFSRPWASQTDWDPGEAVKRQQRLLFLFFCVKIYLPVSRIFGLFLVYLLAMSVCAQNKFTGG